MESVPKTAVTLLSGQGLRKACLRRDWNIHDREQKVAYFDNVAMFKIRILEISAGDMTATELKGVLPALTEFRSEIYNAYSRYFRDQNFVARYRHHLRTRRSSARSTLGTRRVLAVFDGLGLLQVFEEVGVAV